MPTPIFIESVGQAIASNVCVPGAELWVTPGGYVLVIWHYAGVCPEAGTVTCAASMLPNGKTIDQFLLSSYGASGREAAICFQDQRLSGGGGGSSTPGTAASGVVVMQPGEFTPEQSAEIYASMFTVFGAFLALVVAIRGYQFIVGIFNRDSSSGSD